MKKTGKGKRYVFVQLKNESLWLCLPYGILLGVICRVFILWLKNHNLDFNFNR